MLLFPLTQRFSEDLECKRNIWETLLKTQTVQSYPMKTSFRKYAVDQAICISNRFPDNGNAAGPEITVTSALVENS